MGALYHLKQKLVDFCNVIQENVSRTDTVPSSKVVYDLKADTDADIQELNNTLTPLARVVKTITVRASAPITIQTGTYAMVLFIGFAQGIGGVAIAVKRTATSVSAYDVTTGSSFSDSYLKFESVSDGIRVTSTSDASSTFTIILSGS